MKKVSITSEFITLGQMLKFVGIIDSGAMAKAFLAENVVYVEGELDNRRGRKLYPGYQILINDEKYIIEKK